MREAFAFAAVVAIAGAAYILFVTRNDNADSAPLPPNESASMSGYGGGNSP